MRLTKRTAAARVIATARLDGYRLCFNKRSVDGSAKCNLEYTASPIDTAHAVVYDLPEDEVRILDDIEGVGKGYFRQQLSVVVNNESITVFTYFASESHLVYDLPPYDWYKEFVVAGARYHQFPGTYVQQISEVPGMRDTDSVRRLQNEKLLGELERRDEGFLTIVIKRYSKTWWATIFLTSLVIGIAAFLLLGNLTDWQTLKLMIAVGLLVFAGDLIMAFTMEAVAPTKVHIGPGEKSSSPTAQVRLR